MDHSGNVISSQAVKEAEERIIHDNKQYFWELKEERLIATSFKKDVTPVKLEIIACRNEDSLVKNKGKPIYIGIKGQNLCLYCEENQGHTMLKLEAKDIMIDLYNSDQAEKPFVFYYKQTGSTSTFESAACPGWFICTSPNTGDPVMMTKDVGEGNSIEFHLTNPKNLSE